jgi:hypothetical protein
MTDEDVEGSLSANERRQLRKLVKVIDTMQDGDLDKLTSLLKAVPTRVNMAAFETFDAREVLHEAVGLGDFGSWEETVRRTICVELRDRGFTYVPSLIDVFYPGTWWGFPPKTHAE